jgi:hypothetical protein
MNNDSMSISVKFFIIIIIKYILVGISFGYIKNPIEIIPMGLMTFMLYLPEFLCFLIPFQMVVEEIPKSSVLKILLLFITFSIVEIIVFWLFTRPKLESWIIVKAILGFIITLIFYRKEIFFKTNKN